MVNTTTLKEQHEIDEVVLFIQKEIERGSTSLERVTQKSDDEPRFTSKQVVAAWFAGFLSLLSLFQLQLMLSERT